MIRATCYVLRDTCFMKVPVYNLEGKSTTEVELADSLFDVAAKPEVVHQGFVAHMNNSREPWADTKNRGEVSGGGKKPWPQKGTGRARHGSSRSPIWKGGGVTFGPLSIRNYKSKINKKMNRLAIKMCLSDKVRQNALYVLESFDLGATKTKLFATLLKKLPLKQKTFLILTPEADKKVILSTRNLPKITTMPAGTISVPELLGKQAIITTTAGIGKLTELFNK